MTFQCLFTTYFEPLLPLVTALLAFWFAKSVYFRQKEYELITERYLREGLDRVAHQIEDSLGIFRHNWARSLTILKLFRDTGEDMNRDLYKTGFIEPKTEMFEYWADYRVRDLIGDDIVNNARQSLDAFVRTSHTFFKEDLCTAVRLSVEGGKKLEVTASRDEIVKDYMAEVDRLNKESNRYYILLGELHKLASILQTERFSFKKISKFRKSQAVLSSMKKLKEAFADDVKEVPSKDIDA